MNANAYVRKVARRLTKKEIAQCRELRTQGRTFNDCAEKFGVTFWQVYYALSAKSQNRSFTLAK